VRERYSVVQDWALSCFHPPKKSLTRPGKNQAEEKMEEPRTHLGHEDGSASEAAEEEEEEARRGEPAASSASGGGEGEREEGKGTAAGERKGSGRVWSLEDIILFYPRWIGRGRDGRLGSMQRKTTAVSLCIT
jgi:hypothetical protein